MEHHYFRWTHNYICLCKQHCPLHLQRIPLRHYGFLYCYQCIHNRYIPYPKAWTIYLLYILPVLPRFQRQTSVPLWWSCLQSHYNTCSNHYRPADGRSEHWYFDPRMIFLPSHTNPSLCMQARTYFCVSAPSPDSVQQDRPAHHPMPDPEYICYWSHWQSYAKDYKHCLWNSANPRSFCCPAAEPLYSWSLRMLRLPRRKPSQKISSAAQEVPLCHSFYTIFFSFIPHSFL